MDLPESQVAPDAKVQPSSAQADRALPNVVVVGGGAAGLELVTRLGERLVRRGRARVTLVECDRVQLWKPLLHEVAAAVARARGVVTGLRERCADLEQALREIGQLMARSTGTEGTSTQEELADAT